MISALLGIALAAAVPVTSAAQPSAVHAVKPKKKAAAPARTPAPPPEAQRSDSANRVAAWIASTGDNHGLPYIVIDKPAARLFVFDTKGQQVATGPVLLGIAPGDEATPGVGSKSLSELGPAEKTTPAGRYLARYGVAAGNSQVLWVDYATSVALHTVPTTNPKERRRQRMLSATPDDNRITFGCINVTKATYAAVQPLFRRKGGYVYVLPDEKPLEQVFPGIVFMPPAPPPLPPMEVLTAPAS